MNWLEPWYETDECSLVAELKRELVKGHVLYKLPVQVIARRQDCDDVLFQLLDGTNRFAAVRLTFNKETSSDWPRTEIFSSIDHFGSQRMSIDHEMFNA